MLRRFAWGVLAYNLGVILWGAFVRATGSGAGCGSHWPTCNGEVVHRPESVETLIELTHRVTSGLALVLVVAVAIAAFRARPKGHPMRPAAVATVVLMLLEAAIGAGIVLLEYVADDQSTARAYWMAAHLMNTFLLVGAMALTAWWAAPDARAPRSPKGAGPLIAVLVATLLVGVTGAVTALGDTLFPSGSLAEGVRADFAPTAHFLVRLRVWHPIAAVVVAIGAVIAARVAASASRRTRALSRAVIGLFAAQIALGFVNLALLVPVWTQLLHLLLADALWIALVLLTAERALAGEARSEVSSAAPAPS